MTRTRYCPFSILSNIGILISAITIQIAQSKGQRLQFSQIGFDTRPSTVLSCSSHRLSRKTVLTLQLCFPMSATRWHLSLCELQQSLEDYGERRCLWLQGRLHCRQGPVNSDQGQAVSRQKLFHTPVMYRPTLDRVYFILLLTNPSPWCFLNTNKTILTSGTCKPGCVRNVKSCAQTQFYSAHIQA